uniref:Reverse transcriptase Ty1/copia-type domain-containing protein n=1 Tax=Fagus sylvatica TaxID=28930 RepID=A0A2N9G3S6_FAGSY
MDKNELPKTVIAACPSSSSRNGSEILARTVISRDIFWLNARPSNVGTVTRLVTLSTTCPTKPPKPAIFFYYSYYSCSSLFKLLMARTLLLAILDPRTNQVLGTGRRVGRMFELTSLHLPTTSTPPPSHVAPTTSVFPLKSLAFTFSVPCAGTSQQNGRAERKHRHILDSVRAFPHFYLHVLNVFWGETAHHCCLHHQPSSIPQFSKMCLPLNVSMNLDLVCVVFLGVELNTKVIVVGILSLNVFAFLVMLFSGNIPHLISLSKFTTCSTPSFFTNPSLPLFPHASSPDPPPILPIPPADSLVSPLAPPLAMDPVLDQTPDLPSAAPIAPPPILDPILDQTPDLPLAIPSATSLLCFPFMSLTPIVRPVLIPLWQSRPNLMAILNGIRLVLLPRDMLRNMRIDYEETFASVTRITSIRSLLAIAAVHQWPLSQMDVKNVFLNTDIIKESICRHLQVIQTVLTRFAFFVTLFMVLNKLLEPDLPSLAVLCISLGFSFSPHDTALFIRRSDKGMILLLLYVDDMIITGDDHSSISDFKQFLHQHFEMKDLGHLSYFIGLEVSSNSTSYYLSQAKYAFDLLSHAGLTDTKVVSTPLEMNARLTPLDGTPLSDATLYRQLVGSLVYLTITHPDIAHAVHLVSQFLTIPHSTHYATVIHILCYIKGTMFHGLHFSAHSTLDLCAYFDADWIAHNDVFHERTKHIEIDCHLVRYHLSAGILRLLPVSSSDQIADIFTKTFPPGRFRDLVSKLKMASVTNFQCGGYSIGISCTLLLADLLVTTENVNLDGEVCKSLASLCIEEAESRLCSKMASEFYLFLKENSEVIKMEKCSKHGHVKPQLSLKTRVTCVGWDDLGAKEIEFRDGNKPMHVSYWIGSILDGLVIAFIPPLNQATRGVNILVAEQEDHPVNELI